MERRKNKDEELGGPLSRRACPHIYNSQITLKYFTEIKLIKELILCEVIFLKYLSVCFMVFTQDIDTDLMSSID